MTRVYQVYQVSHHVWVMTLTMCGQSSSSFDHHLNILQLIGLTNSIALKWLNIALQLGPQLVSFFTAG